MITALIGDGGAGKTSFLVFLLERYVLNEGKERLKNCTAQIKEFNKGRARPLSLPDKPPFYTNFDVCIPVGYKKKFSPYFLNPYYFGIPNLDKEVQPVMPWSVALFTETDKIYDSREKSLPESVSGMYNKQRHFWLDIFIELHRGMNADTLVRSNVHRFIEIQNQERELNSFKEVVKTTWHCREFEGVKNYMQYVETHGGAKTYTETTYTHVGNIFGYYNSRGCAKEFIPKDGQDFSLLKQPGEIDVDKLPAKIAKYYNPAEPNNWRNKKS